MRWLVADANPVVDAEYRGVTASVVGQWLGWEIDQCPHAERTGDAADADVVLLVHSGSMDFARNSRRCLLGWGIEPEAARRREQPVVVTGGAVDATPRTALRFADVCTVGEAYRGVRAMLACRTPEQVMRWATDDPHTVTRRQFDPQERDESAPWLLPAAAAKLASPDPWVDWGTPDVTCDDGVTRIVGSKGCKMKCAFCATTFRQGVARRDEVSLRARVETHSEGGRRPQIVSNDPINIPGFRTLHGSIDSASMTVMELLDDENLLAVARNRPKVIRVGMEGMSARIRSAFGKPVTDDEFLDRIARLHGGRTFTHSFWVCGAPWETARDWAEWYGLLRRMGSALDWGRHRLKLTAFQPNPPAPLQRFVPQRFDNPQDDVLSFMMTEGLVSRVHLLVPGGQSTGWGRRVAEQYGVRPSELPLRRDTPQDLAPTVDHWRRFPSEIIEWPISAARRWKMADLYRERMTGERTQATGRRRARIPVAAA